MNGPLRVPQLSVAPSALQLIANKLSEKAPQVETWFKTQWAKTKPPLYGSVDMRNAGFKLAPVDMNLFPAGFNNLNTKFLSTAVEAAGTTIAQLAPQTKKIAIIPESHTRNLAYFDSVAVLVDILTQAGFTARVASLSEELTETLVVELAQGGQLKIEPAKRQGDRLQLEDFDPDLLILNNDLSSGVPEILKNLQQPLLPSAELGWHQRLKSTHFEHYASLSHEFAQLLDIDPWLITPLSRSCGELDFLQREGFDALIDQTAALFVEIEAKYEEYSLDQPPFIIVKADAGTYGMAVMTVRSLEELEQLNRKQRNSMAKSKGGVTVRQVIIQEGVYSYETYGPESAVAEPVIYLWGQHVVGGFYRLHQERGPDENLNTPGVQFESLPFSWNCSVQPQNVQQDPYQEYLYIYGLIAQLSMLAAARE